MKKHHNELRSNVGDEEAFATEVPGSLAGLTTQHSAASIGTMDEWWNSESLAPEIWGPPGAQPTRSALINPVASL